MHWYMIGGIHGAVWVVCTLGKTPRGTMGPLNKHLGSYDAEWNDRVEYGVKYYTIGRTF